MSVGEDVRPDEVSLEDLAGLLVDERYRERLLDGEQLTARWAKTTTRRAADFLNHDSRPSSRASRHQPALNYDENTFELLTTHPTSSSEDLPNTTPDDWAKIAGKKGERIISAQTSSASPRRRSISRPATGRAR